MFDEQVFHSWMYVFGGACLFAVLFGSAALMSDLLFDGMLYLSRRVVGLALAAFFGYVTIALIVRHTDPPGEGS